MKNGFLKLVRLAVAPVALVATMAAFNPVSAFAADHGRGGFGGGHGGFSGGHAYSAPAPHFDGGRGFVGHANGGDHWVGRGYWGGPGFSVGIGGYGYVAPACNPAGYYDPYGNWIYYPGCAVPYGY
jgi:hypothetical protein